MAGRNPWLTRRYFHWAHQGGAREAPSNTIYAMNQAVQAGADGLEFDVHRTKDNVVVVIHDKTLGRTTNAEQVGLGAGTLIRDCTLAELQRLDAAYWWVPGQVADHTRPADAYPLRGKAPADPTLGVPTMDEILTRFRRPFTIEIKDKRAVRPVLELLDRHAVPADDVIVTSFRERTVWNLRWRRFRSRTRFGVAPGGVSTAWFFVRSRLGGEPRRSPYVAIQVPPAFAFEDLPRRYRWLVRLLPRRWRSFTVVDGRFVAHADAAGVAVHVWTIDRRHEMVDLYRLGVHGIMTDCPSVLATIEPPKGDE